MSPSFRGRLTIVKLTGGNVLLAPPHYPLDFDAKQPLDRDRLANALVLEFKLLVEVEELPSTFGDFDLFCEKIVREPEKRNLSRVAIYCA